MQYNAIGFFVLLQVVGEASILFPLLVAETFARDFYGKNDEVSNGSAALAK